MSSLFYTQPPKSATLQPFRLKVEHLFEQKYKTSSSLISLQKMKTYHFESRNSTLKNYWKSWFTKQKVFKLQENFVWKMFSEKYFSNTPWSNCSMTTSYHQFRRQSGGTHLHSIYAPADWKLKCQNEEKTISILKNCSKIIREEEIFQRREKILHSIFYETFLLGDYQ